MAVPKLIPVIGVVGGIGSGKSFFAKTLAKRKNVAIVDGDVAGHELLLRSDIRHRIRARFGDEVFAADGSIQRRSLARIIFGSSSEHIRSKADLEAIVHPPLAVELHNQITAAKQTGRFDAIILDAAILLEAGWRKFCDAVVMVEVSDEIRLQRVQSLRGWSEAEFHAREATQMPLDQKRTFAEYFVVNEGPIEAVENRCFEVFDQIVAKFHGIVGKNVAEQHIVENHNTTADQGGQIVA